MDREALTPATSALARAMVGWTQTDLATRSGVTHDTVANFEAQRHRPRHGTLTALLRAFRGSGLGFLMQGGEATCVRLDQPAIEPDAPQGSRAPLNGAAAK